MYIRCSNDAPKNGYFPHNPATLKCKKCKEVYCPNCALAHQIAKATKKHILSIIVKKTGKMDRASYTVFCTLHPEKQVKYFCKHEHCQIPVCSTCRTNQHGEHDCVRILDKLSIVKRKKRKSISEISNRSSMVEESIDIHREKNSIWDDLKQWSPNRRSSFGSNDKKRNPSQNAAPFNASTSRFADKSFLYNPQPMEPETPMPPLPNSQQSYNSYTYDQLQLQDRKESSTTSYPVSNHQITSAAPSNNGDPYSDAIRKKADDVKAKAEKIIEEFKRKHDDQLKEFQKMMDAWMNQETQKMKQIKGGESAYEGVLYKEKFPQIKDNFDFDKAIDDDPCKHPSQQVVVNPSRCHHSNSVSLSAKNNRLMKEIQQSPSSAFPGKPLRKGFSDGNIYRNLNKKPFPFNALTAFNTGWPVSNLTMHKSILIAISSNSHFDTKVYVNAGTLGLAEHIRDRIRYFCPKVLEIVSMERFGKDKLLVCHDQKISILSLFKNEIVDLQLEDWHSPAGIALDNNGNIVFTDWGKKKGIKVFTGNSFRVVKKNTCGKDYFLLPRYLCVNVNGDYIVSDWGTRSVMVFDKMGRFKSEFKKFQKGKWAIPGDICCDYKGNIYVIDPNKKAIVKLNPDGIFQKHILSEKVGLVDPFCLHLSLDKKLFVGQTNGRISAYKLWEPPSS